MGKPFTEKRAKRSAAASSNGSFRPAAQGRLGRGIAGWILFIGVAVAMFVYLQVRPALDPPPSASTVTAPPTPIQPFDHFDTVALTIYLVGLVLLIAAFALLQQISRQSKRVTRWHFDDTGIYTDDQDGEHAATWEWISGIHPQQGGLLIDRGIAGTRFFPDRAFDNAAERQAFLDTFARYGVPTAKAAIE